ncbi:MAG: DUF6677 family protein [Planctomycetota bacterium]
MADATTDSSAMPSASPLPYRRKPVDPLKATRYPAPVIALAGWLLPGLGYVLIGETRRGLIAGAAILVLFFAGLLVGGVRVVDVPGFDDDGNRVMLADGRWSLTAAPHRAVLGKSWYAGQILAGPVTLAASVASVQAASSGYPQGTAHLEEISTLYCAVAGMLNLVVLMDAAHRAVQARSRGGRR